MPDSEEVVKGGDDDVASLVGAIGFNHGKIAVFVFLLFMFITSDVFVDRVLGQKMAVGRVPTTQGAAVQGLLMALGYIMLHVLVSYGFV
jgi:hypothetical protein